MYDVTVQANGSKSQAPSIAFREIEQGIKSAIRLGQPVHVEITMPDGKTRNYNLSEPHDRACVALLNDVMLGQALKDLEPEAYVAREIVEAALSETLPKRYSYSDPEGVPVEALPGSVMYDTEENLREKASKDFITEFAPRLIAAYESTFCQSSMTIDRGALADYEHYMAQISFAMKWSRMHRDELRWWMLGRPDAPFASSDAGLRARLVDELRRL